MRTAITLLLLVSATPTNADDALRKEIGAIAKGISEAIKGLGHDAIAVGSFSGPVQFATGSGALIAKTLGDELTKNGLVVKDAASIEVKGEFDDVKDKQSGLLAARIKG